MHSTTVTAIPYRQAAMHDGTTESARPPAHGIESLARMFVVLMVAAAPALGDPYRGVEARLSAPVTTVHPGKPVRVQFALFNNTDGTSRLTVPGADAVPAHDVVELPRSHIFSGEGFGGLTIRGDYDREWKDAFGYVPPAVAPELVLGPHTFVGQEIDLAEYFPALHVPGLYRIVWQPYGGLLTSNQLTIEIATLKQAEIITDDGAMTVQFLYDLAPNHVANFIELARNGFYDQKTFHRIEPGYFIQGGCPNGDGSGIRADGKKLKAEFSSHPIERGVVCMARLERDPDSASCQFLIVNTRVPNWDGKYTVFGRLIGDESERTLDKLMLREADQETGRPTRTIFIRSVRITDVPITEDVTSHRGGGLAETSR
jgi:cyclophilin family peptidyl-prolyl cis-trans isomerase